MWNNNMQMWMYDYISDVKAAIIHPHKIAHHAWALAQISHPMYGQHAGLVTMP